MHILFNEMNVLLLLLVLASIQSEDSCSRNCCGCHFFAVEKGVNREMITSRSLLVWVVIKLVSSSVSL